MDQRGRKEQPHRVGLPFGLGEPSSDSGSNGPHPGGQAGGIFNPGIGHHHHGPGRGHLVQIAQQLHLQLALRQHIPLAGQIAGRSSQSGGVGVDGLMAVGGGGADVYKRQ